MTTRLWQKPIGNNKKFNSPHELWNEAIDYFDWIAANPLLCRKTGREAPRAMSIASFCRFTGLNPKSFYAYEQDEGWDDVIQAIRGVIYEQKHTHGMIENFNPMLVARDLQLSEKTDIVSNVTTSHGFTFEGVAPDED